MLALWLSLAVLLAALIVGGAYAGLRGLRLWRLVKRTGATFGAEAERISAATAKIEQHLDAVSEAGERLRQADDRLADSRTRLDVQLAAVREARAQVRRTLLFVPGL